MRSKLSHLAHCLACCAGLLQDLAEEPAAGVVLHGCKCQSLLFTNPAASCSFQIQDLAEEEQLVWYCMACEKHFKSEAAFDNHERSKKHLQQVG